MVVFAKDLVTGLVVDICAVGSTDNTACPSEVVGDFGVESLNRSTRTSCPEWIDRNYFRLLAAVGCDVKICFKFDLLIHCDK